MNMLMNRCLLAVALLGAALAGPTRAGVIYGLGDQPTLADLENMGSIVVGDKRFSNFVYTAIINSPTEAQVVVQPYFDSIIGGWGLQFSGAFFAGAGFPLISEAGLSFDVEALDPNMLISDVHLFGTPAVVVGEGLATIVEDIQAQGLPGSVPALRIFEVVDNGETESMTSDDVLFPNYGVPGFRKIRVTKDILVVAEPNGLNLAKLTTFNQVFTQRPIPEPGTLAVAALAMCGASAVSLRRRWG